MSHDMQVMLAYESEIESLKVQLKQAEKGPKMCSDLMKEKYALQAQLKAANDLLMKSAVTLQTGNEAAGMNLVREIRTVLAKGE